MNSRIVLFIKNFNKNLLIGTSCLLLQGCATWFQSSEKAETVTPESTLIDGKKDHLDQAGTEISKPELAETTKVGPQHLRALPRRPEKVETIEINLDDEIEEPIAPVSQETFVYTVQKGDTLSSIAKKFHVNVECLVKENRLVNKNKLSIGQVLSIPANGIDENANYIVKKGDSLSSIAKKFNTSVDKIRTDNHLKTDVIFVGQKLSFAGEKEQCSSEVKQIEPIETEKYIVQSGDILWNIARRCGMSVKQLMEINNISDPKNLRVGQVLYVKAQPIEEDALSTEASTEDEMKNLTTDFDNTSENDLDGALQAEKQQVNTLEEDNFEDLFDESNDIPVVPLEEIK